MLISQREYARQKGCSVQYVNKLVKEGRIVLTSGKIDPATADAGWNGRTQQPRADVPKPETPAPTVRESPSSNPNSYLAARTFHETYKAKREKLLYEQLQGKLVDGDLVLEKASNAFQNCRVRMRGLAKSMAPILASHTSPAEIEKIMADAIEGALTVLSDDVFK